MSEDKKQETKHMYELHKALEDKGWKGTVYPRPEDLKRYQEAKELYERIKKQQSKFWNNIVVPMGEESIEIAKENSEGRIVEFKEEKK